VTAVAVTGASGFLGQGFLRKLGGTGVCLIGLDVREPAYRPPDFRFHLVDLPHADLSPLLAGVDVVVHLAGIHDAIPDERLMAEVNVAGARQVLEAARAVGVKKLVVMSSATVYGAWPNNPVPLNEDAPIRPNRGFPLAVHKAEVERLLAEWGRDNPGAVVTVLRPAFVLGPRADHVVARMVARPAPVVLAGSAAPVQFVHEEDVASALALAVEQDLPGAFNVAADGWLPGRSSTVSWAAVSGLPCPLVWQSAACGGYGIWDWPSCRPVRCPIWSTPGWWPTTVCGAPAGSPATATRKRF
jgi:UDP-glucose 4-epimerase